MTQRRKFLCQSSPHPKFLEDEWMDPQYELRTHGSAGLENESWRRRVAFSFLLSSTYTNKENIDDTVQKAESFVSNNRTCLVDNSQGLQCHTRYWCGLNCFLKHDNAVKVHALQWVTSCFLVKKALLTVSVVNDAFLDSYGCVKN